MNCGTTVGCRDVTTSIGRNDVQLTIAMLIIAAIGLIGQPFTPRVENYEFAAAAIALIVANFTLRRYNKTLTPREYALVVGTALAVLGANYCILYPQSWMLYVPLIAVGVAVLAIQPRIQKRASSPASQQ
jgi:hypothetical protein